MTAETIAGTIAGAGVVVAAVISELSPASVAVLATAIGALWRMATDYSRLKTIQENMVTRVDLQKELGKLDEKFVTRHEWNLCREQENT